MSVEWYLEFIDTKYEPSSDDIIAYYYFEPKGVSTEECIGRIASESSIGTWTTLSTLTDRIYKMRARAYWYDKNHVKIAYPLILWEEGSVPQLLSGIAGNIFGMKAVKNLRLIDATLPKKYIRHFKGPNYGQRAIKKIFKRKHGPIVATVPKPKVGMTSEQHARVAYEAWTGGVDCVKDDENLSSLRFNRFEKRVELLARMRDRAEKETGEIKDAFINATSPNLKELERRIKLIHDHGFKYFMIDIITSGFTAVQTASELAHDLDMAIHGHRAMHAAFTKHKKHGVSMLFIAKLARLIGVDNLHIGTVVGKLDSPKEEVLAMKELLIEKQVSEIPELRLSQEWGRIPPALPVASGGLHPGILPELFRIYGTMDIGIQVGGGIHGHPRGTHAGALAVSQALEAIREGISLKEMAEKHEELKLALEKWGYMKPK